MKPTWSGYRARCIEHPTGCRQCGKSIADRRAYCSVDCSDVFQQNHFWDTARWEAIRRACPPGWTSVYQEGALCKRCGEKAWPPEVNHIVPVNGLSRIFGCCNHQENLEVLCHECHLKATAEQRAAGLIGPPKVEPPLLALASATTTNAVDPAEGSSTK
jgi:5-methylcytosine-specific restriction endonuclease McrA